jgi:hypothetical protein
MDSETFQNYLDNRYYEQLNYYRNSSGKNQKKYRYFQWALIILSASTPVLAALNSDIGLQYLVVGVSAIVAILTTGLKTFQYQELWANYRATAEQLKPEIHYYNFNVGPYGVACVDKEALFISRVEAILDKEHQGWPPAKKLRDDRSLGEDPGTPPSDKSLAS